MEKSLNVINHTSGGSSTCGTVCGKASTGQRSQNYLAVRRRLASGPPWLPRRAAMLC